MDKENKKQNIQKEQTPKSQKILTVVGIIICIILVPILVVNITMIIKGIANKDKVPTFAGFAPLIVYTDSMNPPTTEEFYPIYPIDMTFTGKSKEGLNAVTADMMIDHTDNKNKLSITIDGEKTVYKKIKSGDLILIKTAKADDIKVGDVISFFDPDSNGTSVVTHRVVALEYDASGNLVSFRTRGDSNNTVDKTPVPINNLVGKWTGKTFTGAGSVALFLQSTPGLIICIAIPVVLLVAFELITRKKNEKANKQESDALLKELEELRKLKEEKENNGSEPKDEN